MGIAPKSQAELLEEISGLFEQFAHLEKAESERVTSLQFYKALVNNFPDPVLLLHTDCTIRFANPTVHQVLGYSQEDLKSHSIFDFIHEEDISRGEEQISKMVEHPGRTFPCLNVRLYKKDGTYLEVRGRGKNLVADDNVSGLLVTFRDITGEKKFDEHILHGQKMEALGHIAGGIAHDFRNILAIIMGAAQMMELEPTETQVRQYLDMILSSVKRGTTITERILAFARAKEPEFQEISGLSYLENIREITFHTLPKIVRTTVEPYKKDDRIYADPGQLQQVLLNLCLNAANAMPDGGEITLGMEEPSQEILEKYKPDSDKDYLCITVSDTGSGMDTETLQHVFEPFFTTKDEGDGTGLGLSVVYRTMQQHDGWIDIASEPGKGTKVTLGLLKAKQTEDKTAFLVEAKSVTEEDEVAEEQPAKAEHLLVVEDESYLRDLLTEVLEAQGYRISAVPNGEDAFLLYEDDPADIDLIITDLNMPIMGGKELERNIHLLDPEKKIIAITGNIIREEHNDLAEHDFLAVIIKPFDIQKVLKTIRNILDGDE